MKKSLQKLNCCHCCCNIQRSEQEKGEEEASEPQDIVSVSFNTEAHKSDTCKEVIRQGYVTLKWERQNKEDSVLWEKRWLVLRHSSSCSRQACIEIYRNRKESLNTDRSLDYKRIRLEMHDFDKIMPLPMWGWGCGILAQVNGEELRFFPSVNETTAWLRVLKEAQDQSKFFQNTFKVYMKANDKIPFVGYCWMKVSCDDIRLLDLNTKKKLVKWAFSDVILYDVIMDIFTIEIRKEWAICIFDTKECLQVHTRDIDHDEIRHKLRKRNWDHIPILLKRREEKSNSKFRFTCSDALYPGSCVNVGDDCALLSGALATQEEIWLLTVGHMFKNQKYDVKFKGQFIGSSFFHERHFLLESNGNPYITADIALIAGMQDDRPTCFSYGIKDTIKTQRYYNMSLSGRDTPKTYSRVMLVDRKNETKLGHIYSHQFTDKDEGIYRTIALVGSSSAPPYRSITSEGDSGAPVCLYQDIEGLSRPGELSCDSPEHDVEIIGIVIGVYDDREKSGDEFTIINNLANVIDNIDDQIRSKVQGFAKNGIMRRKKCTTPSIVNNNYKQLSLYDKESHLLST